MEHIIEIQNLLTNYFLCSAHRLNFIASFTVALIQVKTVNWSDIAPVLSPFATKESNYRRIQRFFELFSFEKSAVARFVLEQFPVKDDYIICLDRTNWKFAALNINILTFALAYQGVAFPLLWMLLPKQGNSNQGERISLMEKLLLRIPASKIKALLADREFIGKDWFKFLVDRKIPFHIRIRQNMLAKLNEQSVNVFILFANLAVGESRTLHNRYMICGQMLWVTGMRLENGEMLIIVTNANPKESLDLYAQRWEIEMLFKALKTAGFNLEDTHIDDLDKIDTLMSLLTIALVWAHKVGERLHNEVRPIKKKKHGYRAQSVFRYGLDYLINIFSFIHLKLEEFIWCLEVLWGSVNPKRRSKPFLSHNDCCLI